MIYKTQRYWAAFKAGMTAYDRGRGLHENPYTESEACKKVSFAADDRDYPAQAFSPYPEMNPGWRDGWTERSGATQRLVEEKKRVKSNLLKGAQ